MTAAAPASRNANLVVQMATCRLVSRSAFQIESPTQLSRTYGAAVLGLIALALVVGLLEGSLLLVVSLLIVVLLISGCGPP